MYIKYYINNLSATLITLILNLFLFDILTTLLYNFPILHLLSNEIKKLLNIFVFLSAY